MGVVEWDMGGGVEGSVRQSLGSVVTGAAPFVSINFILDDTGKSRHKLRVVAWGRKRGRRPNAFDFDECFRNKAGPGE